MRGLDETHVRSLALQAARWLELIKFRARPSAPSFDARISTYHEMVAPDAEWSRLLEACERMRASVGRQMVLEQIAAEEAWRNRDKSFHDPYGLVWRKTERGALLELIAELLSEALARAKAMEEAS